MGVKISAVDWQRFDADPDLTLHFDADLVPDPDSDPTLSFTHVGKSYFFIFTAIHVYIVLSFSSAPKVP